MPDTSTCLSLSCRTKVDGVVERCPKCNSKMRTPKMVKRYGWVLLGLGLFLVGMMAFLYLNLAPMMLHPGDETSSGSSFTGTADQGRMILALFGLIFAFGLASMFNGIWQIRTGQRNLLIMWIVLGLAAVLGVFAWVTYRTLK
jgi:MFS family permease